MPKERPDYITVRLSDAALSHIGEDAQVRFANAHAHYVFTGSQAVEVLRRPEWELLQQATLPTGEAMFQPESTSATVITDSISSEA